MNGGAWLVLGCLLVGWWCMRGSRSTSGRSVAIRGHGHDRPTIARHEAGHAAAARALGGRVRSATVTNSSGLVRAQLPTSDAQAAITFWAAGAAAAGTHAGAHADEQLIRRELRMLPPEDRRRVEHAARADAARIVRQHAGRIDRDAVRLDQKGRL